MRHLYRITSRHGVDLVAADDARQALGAWAAVRDQDCDPAAATAQVEQVDDEEMFGKTAARWVADAFERPHMLPPWFAEPRS